MDQCSPLDAAAAIFVLWKKKKDSTLWTNFITCCSALLYISSSFLWTVNPVDLHCRSACWHCFSAVSSWLPIRLNKGQYSSADTLRLDAGSCLSRTDHCSVEGWSKRLSSRWSCLKAVRWITRRLKTCGKTNGGKGNVDSKLNDHTFVVLFQGVSTPSPGLSIA